MGCTFASRRLEPVNEEGRPMDEEKIVVPEKQKGGIGYILLWVLGVPIPVLLLIFLVRGCT
jgi:hypothetical protein